MVFDKETHPTTAYVVVDIEVTDPEGDEGYKRAAPGAVAAFGGKYLARGGSTEVLEGDWHPRRLVTLEFDSVARPKEWLNSAEYLPARQVHHRTAPNNMIVVEGGNPAGAASRFK